MNKKMYLLIILFAVFCSLSVVYAMGAAPPAKTQEISSEAFAPGTYKIYKNDDLGFSFKYPKEWYLTRYEKLGFYYYYLSNLAKPGLPSSENEVVRIKIFETRLPDHEVQTKEEIIKKAIEGLESVKYFKEINVEGGVVYLVRGSSTMTIGDTDFGYMCLPGDEEKSTHLIEFSPNEISKKYEREYFKMLKSIKIFHK